MKIHSIYENKFPLKKKPNFSIRKKDLEKYGKKLKFLNLYPG